MNIRLAPHTVAGWLLFVPALAVMGIWFIYLFVAMPDNLTVWEGLLGQLRYTFSDENPQAWWFAWLVALPTLCAVFGLAYVLNLARSRGSKVALLGAIIALATATAFLNNVGLAALVAVPAIWGFLAIHAT